LYPIPQLDASGLAGKNAKEKIFQVKKCLLSKNPKNFLQIKHQMRIFEAFS